MRNICRIKDIPQPNFITANTPSDVIGFIQEYGYPIILKPTLSCAAVGISVINSDQELERYLEREFCIYNSIDIRQRHLCNNAGCININLISEKGRFTCRGIYWKYNVSCQWICSRW
jgi:carbamoyl-phosphate synthase large subunit